MSLQISCRLLSQETFQISAEPSSTIGDVKRKIEELRGPAFKAENLKLIFAGKVLDNNEATLESEKYDVKGFVVVMVTKAKQPTKSAEIPQISNNSNSNTTTPSVPTSQSSSQIAGEVGTPQVASQQAVQNPAAVSTPTTPAAAPTIHGAFGLTPDEINQMVDAICQMGYPKGEVEQALRASFFNPERAVEYLISGMPVGSEAGAGAPNAAAAAPTPGSAPNQPVGGQANPYQPPNDALANLRDSPQFAMMRQMIQHDPQLLAQFMQSIGQSNPALLEVIRDNEEDFLAMLNSGDLPEGDEGDEMEEEYDPQFPGMANAQDAPAGVHYVNVTEEEKAAIERLKALGFPEQMVIEAFIACDKNEEMAANLLFSGLED